MAYSVSASEKLPQFCSLSWPPPSRVQRDCASVTVVMAESVQAQGLSAGMSELSKEHGEAVGGRWVKMAMPDAVVHFRGVRRKPSGRYEAQIWVPSQRAKLCLGTFATAEEASKAYDAAAVELRARTPGWAGKKRKAAARPDASTEFRGVYRTPSGKYGAQISHSRIKSWLGTFDAAEDAARAYDVAAVKLHGARAVTNFNQPREDKDAAAEPIPVKKEKKAARPDARTKFRGVYRTRRGNYGARIGHSKTRTWLGTFVNAEEAARAYDAVAVKLHGARAITNFKQPSEEEDATAETMMAVKKEESSTDLLNDFLEMPALDFLLHRFPSGAQRDDLLADLTLAERQLVDGFLNDTDFSDVVP